MEIKMYVNWNEREILNEKEFKERIKEWADDTAESTYLRNIRLHEFLTDRKEMDMIDVYDLTNGQKVSLDLEFKEFLLEDAKDCLEDEYDEITVEI